MLKSRLTTELSAFPQFPGGHVGRQEKVDIGPFAEIDARRTRTVTRPGSFR